MVTSSKQLQNRSFQVVERLTTAAKWTKVVNARTKCAKLLFFILLLNLQNLWRYYRCWFLGSIVLALALPPSTLLFDSRIQSTKHKVFTIIWWSCWAICTFDTPTLENNISLIRMPCEISCSCIRTFPKGPLGKCLGLDFLWVHMPTGYHREGEWSTWFHDRVSQTLLND